MARPPTASAVHSASCAIRVRNDPSTGKAKNTRAFADEPDVRGGSEADAAARCDIAAV
jgi:hypothetical protein